MSSHERHLRANECLMEVAGNAGKKLEAGSLWKIRLRRSFASRCLLPPYCVRGAFFLPCRSLEDTDYRLYSFGQTEKNIKGGAYLSGKKFFKMKKKVLSGHYNPEIYFQFQITIFS